MSKDEPTTRDCGESDCLLQGIAHEHRGGLPLCAECQQPLLTDVASRDTLIDDLVAALRNSQSGIQGEIDDITCLEVLLEALHPFQEQEFTQCIGDDCRYCNGATTVVARMSERCEDSGLLESIDALLRRVEEVRRE